MKKTITFFLITMLIAIIPCTVFADLTDLSIDINGIEIGKTDSIHTATSTIETVLGTIQVIGSVASVMALSIIGIRYMISSIEEKAAMKGVLIYYIVGCILVFATSNLLSIVYNVVFNLEI